MKQGIKEKDIRDFEKYAEKLSNVMRKINEYKPEAMAYLANDVLNLMSGDHHNDNGYPEYGKIVTCVHMHSFDGGDW